MKKRFFFGLAAGLILSQVCQSQVHLDWARTLKPHEGIGTFFKVIHDDAGNPYATGWSGYGYLTIKYNTDGIQQWAATYSTQPPNSFIIHQSAAFAIGRDANGNVYVSGESDSNGKKGVALIKYNASGAGQWVKRLDAVATLYQNDFWDMVVDARGNVFITGITRHLGGASLPDTGFVSRFNTSGILQWTYIYPATYDGYYRGNRLKLDTAGNIFLLHANSSATTGMVLTKLSPNGTVDWLRKTTAEAPQSTCGDLAVDVSGNVFITGDGPASGNRRIFYTIKYNNRGTRQWRAAFTTPASVQNFGAAYSIALDPFGSIYTLNKTTSFSAGRVYERTVILKYRSSGHLYWVHRHASDTVDQQPQSFALDPFGNLYVAVREGTNIPDRNILTFKLSKSGLEQWATTYAGVSNDNDDPYSITLFTSSPNTQFAKTYVYVAGCTFVHYGLSFIPQTLLLKYSQPSGGASPGAPSNTASGH